MITILNDMTIKHDGFKILYVRSNTTGKFLKHSLAMNALYNEFISTFLALFTCFSAFLVGAIYLLCK